MQNLLAAKERPMRNTGAATVGIGQADHDKDTQPIPMPKKRKKRVEPGAVAGEITTAQLIDQMLMLREEIDKIPATAEMREIIRSMESKFDELGAKLARRLVYNAQSLASLSEEQTEERVRDALSVGRTMLVQLRDLIENRPHKNPGLLAFVGRLLART